jgi:plasmid stabilization system protein ParE
VKRYRFHPEAQLEARSATTWYRERSSAAAHGFTLVVAEAIQSIREHPTAWPIWRSTEVRRRVLHRYPYSVFYLVEAEEIVIVAVAHHKREPGYWLPRLR